MLIVVGFAQKGELWQQDMPICHRYICQVIIMVAVRHVCLGSSWSMLVFWDMLDVCDMQYE